MHCHHEKLVVIDDEVAFVGGIDLTDLSGDRYDTPGHPARGRLGWHDVASRLRGPAVADVGGHVAERWHAVTGERVEVPTAEPVGAGDVKVQIVRTVPEKIYDFAPRGDFRIIEAYLRALRSAERLVHLENQFLWSPEIVDILAAKLRRPPTDEFRVVIVLPGRANNGEDDTRGQLALLAEADRGQGRFLATTIRARSGRTTDRVYVHAKVGIVDDRWLTLGSANLNAHSFFNDSEVNVVTCDAALARATRLRLWAAHLERDEEEVAGEPSRVVDELWRPIAAEQRERSDRGEPLTHGLVELRPPHAAPHDCSAPSRGSWSTASSPARQEAARAQHVHGDVAHVEVLGVPADADPLDLPVPGVRDHRHTVPIQASNVGTVEAGGPT